MTFRLNASALLLTAVLCLSSAALPAHAADEASPVNSGTGKTKFNALLQTWAVNDTSVVTDNKFNFRLRRAEIKFSGSVVENTRWFVMADAAKGVVNSSPTAVTGGTVNSVNTTSDNKILQDLGVAFSFTPELEFTIGQFKTPTTAEGLDSASELLFPERALVSTAFGDRRELGAQLQYKSGIVKVTGMVSQGTVANTPDTNNEKDLHLRVDVKPIEILSLGAFTTAPDAAWGKSGRFGLNARLAYEQALLRTEYAMQDGSLGDTSGWNIDGGYLVTENIQPIARYEAFKTGSAFTSTAFSFGANYLLLKHNSKVTLTYSMLDHINGTKNSASSGSPSIGYGSTGSLLILAFQAAI